MKPFRLALANARRRIASCVIWFAGHWTSLTRGTAQKQCVEIEADKMSSSDDSDPADSFFGQLKPIPHFRIGERVRIVALLALPAERARYVGRQGIIRHTSVLGGIWWGQTGYLVEVGGSIGSIELPGACLELVVPDGAKPGSWDGLPWKPPLNEDG